MRNEKFKSALADALITEYENLIPETEEHEFSADFEKRMNRLIRRQRKPYYMLINTASKRVACVVACVAIVLCASMAAGLNTNALYIVVDTTKAVWTTP